MRSVGNHPEPKLIASSVSQNAARSSRSPRAEVGVGIGAVVIGDGAEADPRRARWRPRAPGRDWLAQPPRRRRCGSPRRPSAAEVRRSPAIRIGRQCTPPSVLRHRLPGRALHVVHQRRAGARIREPDEGHTRVDGREADAREPRAAVGAPEAAARCPPGRRSTRWSLAGASCRELARPPLSPGSGWPGTGDQWAAPSALRQPAASIPVGHTAHTVAGEEA